MRPWVPQLSVGVAAFALYAAASLARYRRMDAGIDLAIFGQAVKKYAHWQLPWSDIKAVSGFNLLGDHFSPIVALAAPAYWLVPHVWVLLVVQAALVGLTTFLVAWVVARRLGRQWIGIERESRYVKVARARIDSTLELDESAMKVMPSRAALPKVPFGALVETGLIAPGTVLTDPKRRWTAQVLADATLEHGGQQGSIHKIGAAVQGAPSCNGWTFWHVEDAGALVPLDALRQQYLAALG